MDANIDSYRDSYPAGNMGTKQHVVDIIRTLSE
jgi:hypothetical protein